MSLRERKDWEEKEKGLTEKGKGKGKGKGERRKAEKWIEPGKKMYSSTITARPCRIVGATFFRNYFLKIK